MQSPSIWGLVFTETTTKFICLGSDPLSIETDDQGKLEMIKLLYFYHPVDELNEWPINTVLTTPQPYYTASPTWRMHGPCGSLKCFSVRFRTALVNRGELGKVDSVKSHEYQLPYVSLEEKTQCSLMLERLSPWTRTGMR
jgi:hypothetical protein